MSQPEWLIKQPTSVPESLISAIKILFPKLDGYFAAQLFLQRNITTKEQLKAFISTHYYQPASPFEFGSEMKWAVDRLLACRETKEKVTIWGDFDADGITATSVLWEGLGQFFPQYLQLNYYIPNRLTESHGLNISGIEKLAVTGTKLIVTCDTGSTNLKEIEYAKSLGIDIIITDHHTLPNDRPNVVSIINPRYFADTHPLYHLSGVAVAYKLIEALYLKAPDIPVQPLEELLDLVGIGLIADLVQLTGDCRYLAQLGIKQLKKQSSPETATRPGIALLLKLCQKTGDRPTDISFGIGPRINAVSRLQGDASFCVELLTCRDKNRCEKLALETELANARRKNLQKEITEKIKKKLANSDLSTTNVIVLEDPQWHTGVLGLVASQIAQEYARPTILLTSNSQGLALGSARSIQNIDLYQLIESQSHLLHKFGGHPFAAGLTLPSENIGLFREAINQQFRIKYGEKITSVIEADLMVTVSQLDKYLFKELSLIEPCGMGNSTPKLLIKNCWFEKVYNQNIIDNNKKQVKYIKTSFVICDESLKTGFAGVWWGHYKEELPEKERFDAIVELDYNNATDKYQVRLIAIRPTEKLKVNNQELIIDWREKENLAEISPEVRILRECPKSWQEIQRELKVAIACSQKLALAYRQSEQISAEQIWKKLVGIAKYIKRTGKTVSKEQLSATLKISLSSLDLGLKALSQQGLELDFLQPQEETEQTYGNQSIESIERFFEAIIEEQFQQNYFNQVPLSTVKATVSASTLVGNL